MDGTQLLRKNPRHTESESQKKKKRWQPLLAIDSIKLITF